MPMIGSGLFPINSAVEPVNQLGCPYGEGVAYAKEGRERDGSASLYLLPVASGKAKSNHVFLGESSGFAKLFYSLSESAKELFLIDQACLLGDLRLDHHEQISCINCRIDRLDDPGKISLLSLRGPGVREPVWTMVRLEQW